MTTPLQITRYDRVVRRLMNLVGEPAIVTGVLEDVFPVIDMEDLQLDAYRWAGWNIAGGSTAQTGAAGETARISLDNPPGSGTLIVSEGMIFIDDTTQAIRVSVLDAPVRTGIVGVTNFRDTRTVPTAQVPVGQLFAESAAGIPPEAEILRLQVTANTMEQVFPPKGLVVLGPGTQLRCRAFTVATQIQCTFLWRERPLDPSEIT